MAWTTAEIRQLRVGKYLIDNGEPCKIVGMSTSKPGKHGAAKAKMDAVGLFDGQKRTIIAPVTDKIQVPLIERKMGQVLSVQGSTAQLMDMSSYETFEIDVPNEFLAGLEAGKDISYVEAMGRKMITKV